MQLAYENGFCLGFCVAMLQKLFCIKTNIVQFQTNPDSDMETLEEVFVWPVAWQSFYLL